MSARGCESSQKWLDQSPRWLCHSRFVSFFLLSFLSPPPNLDSTLQRVCAIDNSSVSDKAKDPLKKVLFEPNKSLISTASCPALQRRPLPKPLASQTLPPRCWTSFLRHLTFSSPHLSELTQRELPRSRRPFSSHHTTRCDYAFTVRQPRRLFGDYTMAKASVTHAAFS